MLVMRCAKQALYRVTPVTLCWPPVRKSAGGRETEENLELKATGQT